jgi:pSer/pThr/pTyr-binding forkhead associated (FHA) protein
VDAPVVVPQPSPPAPDPPILSSPPFSDLPTESDRIEHGNQNISNTGPLFIRFDDGQELNLDHPLAVGRAPEGSADVPDGAVVVVVSGDQVSRCHFVIRPTETGAEVIDTNSLNGCFLDDSGRPGSGPQIPVGVPVPVEPGQRLRFGDRSLTLIAGRNDT